jgi:hypothetical protein
MEVNPEVCILRHELVDTKIDHLDKEIEGLKRDVGDVKTLQSEFNNTIKNIYYALIVITIVSFFTLAGVLLGRAIDFNLPF